MRTYISVKVRPAATSGENIALCKRCGGSYPTLRRYRRHPCTDEEPLDVAFMDPDSITDDMIPRLQAIAIQNAMKRMIRRAEMLRSRPVATTDAEYDERIDSETCQ